MKGNVFTIKGIKWEDPRENFSTLSEEQNRITISQIIEVFNKIPDDELREELIEELARIADPDNPLYK